MSAKLGTLPDRWKRYRARHRPYASKQCACGVVFHPHGPQKRCSECAIGKCGVCGKRFPQPGGHSQRFCGRSCAAKQPHVVERINRCRGKKPRTYRNTRPHKHGSAEDRDWRAAVFKRDNFTCRVCGTRGGRIQAHHVKGYKAYPALRYDVGNGLTLCADCHKKTPNYGWGGYRERRLAQEVLPI